MFHVIPRQIKRCRIISILIILKLIASASCQAETDSGVLWAIGRNTTGQIGILPYIPKPVAIMPAIKQVAAGNTHSVLLRVDGTVWTSGQGYNGELGDTTRAIRNAFALVASNVRYIAAGGGSTFWIDNDSRLWGSGQNSTGALGLGTTEIPSEPAIITTDVKAVFSGGGHTLFIRNDDSLWGMGANYDGQLGDGSRTQKVSPVKIADNVALASARDGTSLFLTKDGKLWGMGTKNQALGYAPAGNDPLTSPVLISTGVVWCSSGAGFSFFVKNDGTLWVMGRNLFGQLGNGSLTESVTTPLLIASEVESAFAGQFTSAFIKTDGSAWTFGSNNRCQLGNGSMGHQPSPVKVANAVKQFALGNNHTLLLDSNDVAFVIGDPTFGQIGIDLLQMWNGFFVKIDENVSSVIASAPTSGSSTIGTHVLYQKNDGAIWGLGSNADGQLGDSALVNHANPILVFPDAKSFYAGWNHTLLIDKQGTLWGLGQNSRSQLGGEATQRESVPKQIATNVTTAAAGISHTLFIEGDRALRLLGTRQYENSDQIPAPQVNIAESPDTISLETTAVYSGSSHYFFSDTAGRLWGTGINASGQLGDGTLTNRSSPLQIAYHAKSIAAAAHHTLFLLNDGTLWATGENSQGQLGDGTNVLRNIPVKIAENVASLATGPTHSHFLTSDGSLWSMGANSRGQLGDGTFTSSSAPLKSFEQILSVAAGLSNSYFVQRPGGTLPAIVRQPQSVSVLFGQPLVIDLDVIGSGPISFRWRRNGEPIQVLSGFQKRFFLPVCVAADAGTYDVVISNSAGDVISSTCTVEVRPFAMESPIVTRGNGLISFEVEITSNLRLSYQWSKNGTPIVGATAPNLQLTEFQHSEADRYELEVISPSGSETVLFSRPIIDSHPPSFLLSDNLIMLTVRATGAAPLSYQWYRNGALIAGANTSSLNVSGDSFAGNYHVVVRNALGSTLSPITTVAEPITFLTWANSFFSLAEREDSAVSASGADPDHDGLSNLLEYALGTHPRLPNDNDLWALTENGQDWIFTYSRPANRSDLDYAVEASSTLGNSSWSSDEIDHRRISSNGDSEFWVATKPRSETVQFFRLRIAFETQASENE